MIERGNFSFLIVAGGSGSRIGGLEKQFRVLGERPLWRWSMDEALRVDGISEIILVLPYSSSADYAGIPLLEGGAVQLKSVTGGATRTESVRNGLAVSSRSCQYVMVHDAARPFASEALLNRLMESVSPAVGAVPVLPVAEAVKHVDGKNVRVVDRDGLYATQTPQVFFRETLIKVLSERHAASFKDEAEAWLDAGLELRCVEGERLNFKVTWPEDLELAEALVEKREGQKNGGNGVRVGFGYDVHRLVPERPLILGGVVIPSPLGLLGHSDADVLSHAVADALLGAAGLPGAPDIGNLFPASDEKYKGADSLELLRLVVELVRGERWEVVWVDAVLEAQVPRLNSFLPAMAEKLSNILKPDRLDHNDDNLCINIKAKSPEHTGDAGAARSMTCRAVATLKKF